MSAKSPDPVGEAATALTVRTPSGATPGGVTLVSDRYELLAVLGAGGCGTVHKAFDRQLEETVALKLLHDAGREAIARLRQEVKLSRRVSHRNVVRVFDIGDARDGQGFLTMEFIEGESLSARISRVGPMPHAVFVHLARQIAAGVAAAHFAGVAHRDLKPANVLLRNDEVKVTDFGIARSFASGRDFSGTPQYMAPEQIASADGTARSDVYSLGLVFYEMLTGKRAFQGATLATAYDERVKHGPIDLTAAEVDEDPRIVELIRACTELDPADRPLSAAEVRDVLESIPFGPKMSLRPRAAESSAELERKFRQDMAGFRYGWLAAAERLGAALAHEPDNGALHAWLAVAYAHAFSIDWLAEDSFVDRARAAVVRARELAPELAITSVASAMIARSLGDHETAARDLVTALACDPRSPEANSLFGEMLVACGDAAGGIPHLEAACAADPSQPAFRWVLARAYALEGDFESFERVDQPPTDAAQLSSYWGVRTESVSFMPAERLRADLDRISSEDFDLRPPMIATLNIFLGGPREEYEGMLAILREFGSAGSPQAACRRERMRRFLADISAQAGLPDAALDAIEDCDRASSIEIAWLRRSPPLANLRRSPRYVRAHERIAARAEAVLRAARRAPS